MRFWRTAGLRSVNKKKVFPHGRITKPVLRAKRVNDFLCQRASLSSECIIVLGERGTKHIVAGQGWPRPGVDTITLHAAAASGAAPD